VKALGSVYNNFIGLLVQSNEPQELLNFSRVILNSIHAVFPPTTITHHSGTNPISKKKLQGGDGLWEMQKEIPGWVFD
jgi:hypothetical protein